MAGRSTLNTAGTSSLAIRRKRSPSSASALAVPGLDIDVEGDRCRDVEAGEGPRREHDDPAIAIEIAYSRCPWHPMPGPTGCGCAVAARQVDARDDLGGRRRGIAYTPGVPRRTPPRSLVATASIRCASARRSHVGGGRDASGRHRRAVRSRIATIPSAAASYLRGRVDVMRWSMRSWSTRDLDDRPAHAIVDDVHGLVDATVAPRVADVHAANPPESRAVSRRRAIRVHRDRPQRRRQQRAVASCRPRPSSRLTARMYEVASRQARDAQAGHAGRLTRGDPGAPRCSAGEIASRSAWSTRRHRPAAGHRRQLGAPAAPGA